MSYPRSLEMNSWLTGVFAGVWTYSLFARVERMR
jgi:hypothetical protein